MTTTTVQPKEPTMNNNQPTNGAHQMSVFKKLLDVHVFISNNPKDKTMPLYFNPQNGNGYYYTTTDNDGTIWNLCPECAIDCLSVNENPYECHEVSDNSQSVCCNNCPKVIETGIFNEYFESWHSFRIPCDGSMKVFLDVMDGEYNVSTVEYLVGEQ